MIRRRLLLSMLVAGDRGRLLHDRRERPEREDLDTSYAAQMASTWHYVGAPQRVQVGILASDANGLRVVTQGTVDLAFSYLGTDGSGEPSAGPTATASYVPVPGTDASGDAPAIVTGTNGVYEAKDVTFDEAGSGGRRCRSRSTASPAGSRPISSSAGVGDPRTRHAGARHREPHDGLEGPARRRSTRWPTAVARSPTPSSMSGRSRTRSHRAGPHSCSSEHRRTARAGSAARRSPSCSGSRADHPDRAVYIHIEIWKEYDPPETEVVNQGAADWLLRELPDGTPEMTEPWLFLIGADGIVVDRWGPLFDSAEVADALETLPPMKP